MTKFEVGQTYRGKELTDAAPVGTSVSVANNPGNVRTKTGVDEWTFYNPTETSYTQDFLGHVAKYRVDYLPPQGRVGQTLKADELEPLPGGTVIWDIGQLRRRVRSGKESLYVFEDHKPVDWKGRFVVLRQPEQETYPLDERQAAMVEMWNLRTWRAGLDAFVSEPGSIPHWEVYRELAYYVLDGEAAEVKKDPTKLRFPGSGWWYRCPNGKYSTFENWDGAVFTLDLLLEGQVVEPEYVYD